MSVMNKVRIGAMIDFYIAGYGGDNGEIDMVNLRGFARDFLGEPVSPNTLAKCLRQRGYVREGYRRIETCPGKSLFYVLPGKAATHGE
jgi:hypothetical protein